METSIETSIEILSKRIDILTNPQCANTLSEAILTLTHALSVLRNMPPKT